MNFKGIFFYRFWGLLMFGSYSVCNLIVLLNMLIAMMSTSYTAISLRSDTEWKFARSINLKLTNNLLNNYSILISGNDNHR